MSLATRCTNCGTVFRVVRDQLRVSEGWVRCGRCQEVFNALDHLFDLEREAPPPWSPTTASAGLAPLSQPQQPVDIVQPERQSVPGHFDPDPDIERLLNAQASPHDRSVAGDARAPAPAVEPPPDALASEPLLDARDGDDDAPFPSQWPSSILMSTSAEIGGGVVAPLEGSGETTVPPVERATDRAEAAPEFLRRAEREQRWRRPRARALLSVAALLLIGTLAGQVAYHFRDWIVALWPNARPTMTAMCNALNCRIEPLRHIDGISVESTGLTQVGGLNAYKLSVVLRNRSGVPLATPSIDLTLTDPQGQLVARRVLAPSELGATQEVLAPGSEVALGATLSAGEQRLLGYTVEVFYP